jgi:hypothetical protein
MTTASGVRASIGHTLLIQFCLIEIISVIFFTRIGAIVLGGIIAPLWGVLVPFMALAEWSRVPAAPGWLVMGCVALVLLLVGALAWLRFRSRWAAHVAFALYSLWSMLLLLGLK